MRYLFLTGAVAILALSACGGREPAETGPANPAQAVPDGALMYLALEDPAAILQQVDAYMAEGAPALGEGVASEWVLEALDCASFDEVSTRYGLDPHGRLIVFQKGMGNSFGLVVGVADETAVWTNMEEMGLQLEEGEPLDGQPVKTVALGAGFQMQMSVKRGVLLGAVSRPGLAEMVGLLDSSRTADPIPELEPATVYMGLDLAAVAPILSAQMPMIRQQVMTGMEQGGEATPQGLRDMIGLYFDAFGLILEQTGGVEWYMTLGPEKVTSRTVAEYVPGSDLERLMAPVEVEDISDMLPAGEVMVARADMNPELGREITRAFAEGLGFEADSSVMAIAEAFSTTSAFSMMAPSEDNPFHMVAVYHVGTEETLEAIGEGVASMVSFASSMLEGIPVEITEPEIVEIDDRNYLTYGENVAMSAPEQDGMEFSMTFWLTLQDGYLYMESAPEPTVLPQLLDGIWDGVTVAGSGRLDYSSDYEMAFAMNVGAYMGTVMSLSPDSSDIPSEVTEAMSGTPLWIRAGVDMQQGLTVCESSVDGSEVVSFVMNVVMLASDEGPQQQ